MLALLQFSSQEEAASDRAEEVGRRQAMNVAIGDRGEEPRGYRKSLGSTFQPPAAGTVSLA